VNVPKKLALYAVALGAVFVLGLGGGVLAGPLDDATDRHTPGSTVTTHTAPSHGSGAGP
jgi:hypothetical protein